MGSINESSKEQFDWKDSELSSVSSSPDSTEILSDKVVSLEELPRKAPEPLPLLLPPSNKSLSSVSLSSDSIEALSTKVFSIEELPKKAPEPLPLLISPSNKSLLSLSLSS